MRLRATAIILMLAVTTLGSHHACALDVYFGGFAFLGDYQAIGKNYPYSKILAEPGAEERSPIDSALQKKLVGFNNPDVTLVYDRLGALDIASKSTVALGFALERETVSVEKFGRDYKILAELSGQALFFDFRQKTVLAAVPFNVQLIDVKQHAPSNDELLDEIRTMYLVDNKANVLDAFVRALSNVKLNLSVKRYVQVTQVDIAESELAKFPAELQSDLGAIKGRIGQEFGKSLSLNQHIPVLPYTTGHAIGNKLAARFADGSVYNLSLPPVDYAIALSLRELRKLKTASDALGTSYVYGAFLGIKVFQPLSNTIFFDATVKYGAAKAVPINQENVEDWPAYQEALLGLMNNFTQGLDAPTAAWAKKYVGNEAVVHDLQNLHQVLQSCK